MGRISKSSDEGGQWQAAKPPLLLDEIAAKWPAWAITHVNWSDEVLWKKSSDAKPVWDF